MNNRIKKAARKTYILLLLLMIVLSAGCIRFAQQGFVGKTGEEKTQESSFIETDPAQSYNYTSVTADVPQVIVTPSPPLPLSVEQVSPDPYITPDPYRLPYRDHGNWTTVDSVRVPKRPEFIKKIVLRSNATAFMVNVSKGPLVIDLVFTPLFDSPDQTGNYGSSYPSDDKESNDDSSERGTVSGSGTRLITASFVYPIAEVVVRDGTTNDSIAKEGYGGVYSSDLKKTMKIYKNGSVILSFIGDFVDVDLKISTGSGVLPTTHVPITPVPAGYVFNEEDEWLR